MSRTPRQPSDSAPPAVDEPIYVASQLASLCDVDLKTIHNWCDRPVADGNGQELECFRTPGGHLRFRHSAVLRFLSRWGYPIPDELLRDRPHVVAVLPDGGLRAAVAGVLQLEALPKGPGVAVEAKADDAAAGAGALRLHPRFYVHLFDSPYAALVACGQMAGAGMNVAAALLSSPMAALEESDWMRALRERAGTRHARFVRIAAADAPAGPGEEMGVAATLSAAQLASSLGNTLQHVLFDQATEEGRESRRGLAITPREPIFVASEMARLWNVDMKTVHAWAERGEIEAFSTPGGHLRFRRRSLLHLLRTYNLSIPPEIGPAKPGVVVVSSDGREARRIAGLLGDGFEAVPLADPVGALVDIGLRSAGDKMVDAVVVALPAPRVEALRWLEALRRHPDTRYSRLLVVAGEGLEQNALHSAGAACTVGASEANLLPELLKRLLGQTAAAPA